MGSTLPACGFRRSAGKFGDDMQWRFSFWN